MEPSPGPSKRSQQVTPKGPSQGHPQDLAYAYGTDSPASPDDPRTRKMDTEKPASISSASSYLDYGHDTRALSPRSQHERDIVMLARLKQSCSLSAELLGWMGLFLKIKEAEFEGTELSKEDSAAVHIAHEKISRVQHTSASARSTKRRRSRSLSLTPPQHTRPRRKSPSPHPQPLRASSPKSDDQPKPQREIFKNKDGQKTQTKKQQTFAEATKRDTGNTPNIASTKGALKPSTTTCSRELPSNIEPHQKVEKRYPPLVVERIENWTLHFKNIAAKLGRPPNGRPFGQGIRFTPESEGEYRTIQNYLSILEKKENLSWFSYSLPAERSVKVAIRGLPADTDIEEISEALREKQFNPEYIKVIRGRQGRPGCVFFVQLKRTPNVLPNIYNITELLLMPGIKVEAWRAKKGPAQCHRCQKFRHSSHNCHRVQACVRCGEEHAARECARPREEPATCANCGGSHPANYAACPTYQKEARNKRAGTIAETAAGRKNTAPTQPRQVEESAPATLMAPANPPTGAGKKKNRRPKKKEENKEDAEPPPASRRDSLGQTISVLKEILEAVQSGTDAETATLMGLMKILTKNGGT